MYQSRRRLAPARRLLNLHILLLAAAHLAMGASGCGSDQGDPAGPSDSNDPVQTPDDDDGPDAATFPPGADDGSQDADGGGPGPTDPGPGVPDGGDAPEPPSDGTENCPPGEAETGLGGLAFPYIYFDRDEVLLEGIDFEATLKIAELELAHGGASSVLTIWTIRDQIMTASIAARISALYLQYVDGEGLAVQEGIFGHDFAVWHFAWAMGNIYRLGPSDVKRAMQAAYEDALTRPATLNAPYDGILTSHLTEGCIFMGDAHDGGRSYARSHIVLPGNPDYLQSFEDYTPR